MRQCRTVQVAVKNSSSNCKEQESELFVASFALSLLFSFDLAVSEGKKIAKTSGCHNLIKNNLLYEIKKLNYLKQFVIINVKIQHLVKNLKFKMFVKWCVLIGPRGLLAPDQWEGAVLLSCQCLNVIDNRTTPLIGQ